jgi:DNA/RNA-binding domain of Phe-tRNA-synthetase-like protein
MSTVRVAVQPHPTLLPVGFTARWSEPLAAMPSPAWLTAALRPFAVLAESEAPPELSGLGSDEAVRTAVRKLLRHGGYKPSGRGKPASEYLLAAADEGTLGSINLAVDLCNAVSLHAGLPISVVDLALAAAPLHLGIAADDASYVFNATGQEIKLAGLLCLHDAAGPCANAVKDAQRTKTGAETTAVLCIVWGSRELAERTHATLAIYRALTERSGAQVGPVEFEVVEFEAVDGP